MNDQNNMAQLRYLEELKISLVHAGFEPERIEDQHLPVRWENHYLCRVSGRGSVLYRQENVDGIGAQDALQTAINTAAMTAEWKTPYAPIAPGTEGEVDFVDDIGIEMELPLHAGQKIDETCTAIASDERVSFAVELCEQ